MAGGCETILEVLPVVTELDAIGSGGVLETTVEVTELQSIETVTQLQIIGEATILETSTPGMDGRLTTEAQFLALYYSALQEGHIALGYTGDELTTANVGDIEDAATGTDDGGGSGTTIVDPGAAFLTTTAVDDVILNETDGVSLSVVVSVDGDGQLTVADNGTPWTGQAYSVHSKRFTRVLAYTGGELTTITTVDEMSGTTLISALSYASGILVSVTKTVTP